MDFFLEYGTIKYQEEIQRKLDSLLLNFRFDERVEERLKDDLDMYMTDFSNGKGYYQHDPNNVIKFKEILVEYAKKVTKHPLFSENKVEDILPTGIAGRIIDDGSDQVLKRNWTRLMCIDQHGREWGQMFYAEKPKGEFIELNKYINPIFRKEKIDKILKEE